MSKNDKTCQVIPLELLIVSLYSEGIFQKVFVRQGQTESSILHRGPKGFDGGCLEKMPREMAHSGLSVAS
jgi:hypothetical protein